MKHTLKITLILILIFVISQVLGLFVLDQNMNVQRNTETGEVINVTYSDSGYIKDANVSSEQTMVFVISIIIGILIGTGIVLLLAKFRKPRIWRIWFALVVVIGLQKAFAVFIPWTIAISLAIILAAWKSFKPNPIIQNLTEPFMYAGLAIIFVQALDVFAAVLLLIIISIYDMIAVWKSKHMIKLAQFQLSTKAFAGLSVPYSLKSSKEVNKEFPKESLKQNKKQLKVVRATSSKASKKADNKSSKKSDDDERRSAILGGGDIAFPLFFSGVLLEQYGFPKTLIVTATTTLALFALLYWGKKDRFYPAMPFISAGCFVGWGIIFLINFI